MNIKQAASASSDRRKLNLFQNNAIAIVMVAITSAVTYAGDSKLYPGSMCVKWAGEVTPSYHYSAMGNPSGNWWMYVDCPAVRDVMRGEVRDAFVGVIDQNRSHNIGCYLCEILIKGEDSITGHCTSPKYNKSNLSKNEQLINFGKGGSSNILLPGAAHYFIGCKVPPKDHGISYVTRYKLTED